MRKIGVKYKFFTALLLACFACASIFLTIHSFSHNFSQKSGVNLVGEKTSLIASNFVEKTFPIKSHSSSKHDISSCALCFFSNIQNNNIIAASVIFMVAAFYLFLIWRKFDRTKLAYLSSSFLSRAPPFVS